MCRGEKEIEKGKKSEDKNKLSENTGVKRIKRRGIKK